MAKSAGKTGLLLCLLVLMSNVIIKTEASLFWNSEASLSTQVMGFSEPLEICSSFSMCDDEKSLIYGSICPDDRDDSKFCFIRYRSSTPKWKPFCNQSISEKILTIASVTLQVQEQTFKVKLINAFNDKVQKNEVGISFNPPINECEDPCADCISLPLTGLCEDNIVECNSTVCKCKEGFEGPKCCNESICRNNCDNISPISGQLGCTKCKPGYQGRLCCEKLAKNITDRLDSMTVPSDVHFNHYCDIVVNGKNKDIPEMYAYGPKCGGDLSFGIGFGRGVHTMEEDNNLKVDRNTFEKDILAAVEDVFDKFQE